MMKSDDIETDHGASATGRQILAQALVYAGVSCVGGGIAAGTAIGIEEGVDLKLVLVAGGVVLAGIAAFAGGLKIGDFDPPSLKTKAGRSQIILAGSLCLGVLLGMYLVITGGVDRIVSGTFTPSVGEAVVGILIMIALLLIGLVWQKTIDEHETAAAKSAAYWSLSAYLYLYPIWWLAATAGLIPAVHNGAMYLAVLAVFSVVWSVKRAG
jgi:hypothetical protein